MPWIFVGDGQSINFSVERHVRVHGGAL